MTDRAYGNIQSSICQGESRDLIIQERKGDRRLFDDFLLALILIPDMVTILSAVLFCLSPPIGMTIPTCITYHIGSLDPR